METHKIDTLTNTSEKSCYDGEGPITYHDVTP